MVGSLVTEIKKKEAQTGQSHWNDPSRNWIFIYQNQKILFFTGDTS